jgi:hypothetical protein
VRIVLKVNKKNANYKFDFYLLESINASHRCPLCNKDLQQTDIQRDAQYNTLLGLNIYSFFILFNINNLLLQKRLTRPFKMQKPKKQNHLLMKVNFV